MTVPLVAPTDRRRRRTRNAVLNAAQRLFAAHGFRRTSVDELAREADVALSSIYANFPGGKADVYAALACRLAEEHVADMREVMDRAGADTFNVEVFDEYCRFHRDNPQAFALLGLSEIDRCDTELYDEARAAVRADLRALVNAAIDKSSKPSTTARREILTVWAGVNGLLGLRAQGFIDDADVNAMLATLRPGRNGVDG